MDVPVPHVPLEVLSNALQAYQRLTRDINAAQALVEQVEELQQRCGCPGETSQEPIAHQTANAPGGSGRTVWLRVGVSCGAWSQEEGPGYLAEPPPVLAPRFITPAPPQQEVAKDSPVDTTQQQQEQPQQPQPRQSKGARKRKERGFEEAGEGSPSTKKKAAKAAPTPLLVGVSKCKHGWRAKLKASKHLPTTAKGRRSLGVFTTPEEAARAYDRGMLVVQLQYQEKVHIMLNHPLEEYVDDADPAVAAAAARVKARIEARSAARHCAQGQQSQQAEQAEQPQFDQPGVVGFADQLVQRGGLQHRFAADAVEAVSAQQRMGITVDPAPPQCAASHCGQHVGGPRVPAQAGHSLLAVSRTSTGVARQGGPVVNNAEPELSPAVMPAMETAEEARLAGTTSAFSGGSKPKLTPVQALRRQRWQQQQHEAAAAASTATLVAGAPTAQQAQRGSPPANGVPEYKPVPAGTIQQALEPRGKSSSGGSGADSVIQRAMAAAASCSLGYHRLPLPGFPSLALPVDPAPAPAPEKESAAVQAVLPAREARRSLGTTSGPASDEDDMPLARRQRMLIIQRSQQAQQQQAQQEQRQQQRWMELQQCQQVQVAQPEPMSQNARVLGPAAVDSPPAAAGTASAAAAAGTALGRDGREPSPTAEPSQPRDAPKAAQAPAGQPPAQQCKPPHTAAGPGKEVGGESKCAPPGPAGAVSLGDPRPPPLLAAYGLDVRLQEHTPGWKHGSRAPPSLANPPKRRRCSPAAAAERPQPPEQALTQQPAGTAAAAPVAAPAAVAGVPAGVPRLAAGSTEPAQPLTTFSEVIDMTGAESSTSEGASAALDGGTLASARPPCAYGRAGTWPRGLGSLQGLQASPPTPAGVGPAAPGRPASPAAEVLREILRSPQRAPAAVIVLEDDITTEAAQVLAKPGRPHPCSFPPKPLGVPEGSIRSPLMLPAQQEKPRAAAAAAAAPSISAPAPTSAAAATTAATGAAMAAEAGGARVGSQQPRPQQQGAFQFQDPEAARQFKRAFTQPPQGKLAASLRAARKQGGAPAVRKSHPDVPKAAWEQAAQAWRQKNNPTQQELRAAQERQRAQQARPKPATWRPAEAAAAAAAAAAGHAGPAGAGKAPPAPAPLDLQELRSLPEGERRGRYRDYNQHRVAGCATFLQVLLAFKVSCDGSNLKEGYKKAVRMYHPDSNSKERLWASAEQKMECEEIMKIINDRKPASL